MAKSNLAVFAQTPKTFTAVVTEAVEGLDSDTPTNTVELLTAGPEGAIVTSISAMPRGDTTASNLMLFLSKDGTTKHLLASRLLKAHSVTSTTEIPSLDFDYTEIEPLRLEAGDKLFVGSAVALAAGYSFVAQSTDY